MKFVEAARLAIGRMIFVLPGAALLLVGNFASAQETVYIGGSGQSGVEIYLGVLDNRAAPRRVITALQHPGVAQGGLPPVVLRPPLESPNTAAPRNRAPKITEKTEAIDASAASAVKLKAPGLNFLPEPAPVILADKPLEEITPEKSVPALKLNSNQTSGNSLTEEGALTGNDQSKPIAERKVEKKATKPKFAAKTTKAKIAALDPAEAPRAPGDSIQILFPAHASVLPQGTEALLATVAAHLDHDETLRLQLKAYAGGGADAASHARRLSLSRALSVRSELIEQGVRSTRIDVRALGNKSEGGASDRVDIILVKR